MWHIPIGFNSRQGAGKVFFFCHHIQTNSGAHLSYSVGTGVSFPRNKAAGAWIWPLLSIWCRG